MPETELDEVRREAAAVVDEARRHLTWFKDAGIRQLPREESRPAIHAAPIPVEAARPPPPLAMPAPPPTNPADAARVPNASPARSAPATGLFDARPKAAEAGDKATALKVIRDDLGDCHRCGLGATRIQLVYGQGNPEAEILFLGEAPGEDEDKSGLAFVGRAGQLLTKMIEAMGYTREQVYICNINKCRPPGNRKPEPPEVEVCRPFVERQIRAIRPKAIVCLGATAAHSLLRIDTPISRLRNRWTDWEGIPVMPTFHPSYLLRSPQEKGKAWDDLKLVLAKVGREVPKRG
jgi:DNA polymerase